MARPVPGMGTCSWGPPVQGLGGSGGRIFGKTRVGWGECSWSPQAQRFQTGWLCQGIGVGVILGCPASSHGAGTSLGLAGRGDRAGQGGKLLSPAWSACSQSFKENRNSCLDGFFKFPVPQMEPSRLVPLGACGMRYPQLLLPTDLTKTSDPKPEQMVLMC